MEPQKILKKRGRKPKNKIIETTIQFQDNINSENEVVIVYLPITLNDMQQEQEESNDIFIKSETVFSETKNEVSEKMIQNKSLKEKIELLSISDTENPTNSSNGIYINKINIHNINITQNTKCWWCKNYFNTPNVILPESYFDNIFYCIGNFCSYNCCKAYNLDLNDNNVWKRETLINLMYNLTYNKEKIINPAPSWLILEEFGGFMSIDEFRNNFDTNLSEYILLYPPIISRQMQIEESYKKNSNNAPVTKTNMNKLDKLFNSSEQNNYLLKRSKPVETSQLNLEKTMGLRRSKT